MIYTLGKAMNKCGGGAEVAKSINVEGGIFWKKTTQYYINATNEEWRMEEIIKRGGWIFLFKINKRDSTFIREMIVNG